MKALWPREGPAVRRLILGNVFRKPIPQPLQPESPLSPCHPDRSVAKWRDLQCALRLSQILPRKRSQMNHPLTQPDFACRGCGTRLSNDTNTTGSTHPLIWTAPIFPRIYPRGIWYTMHGEILFGGTKIQATHRIRRIKPFVMFVTVLSITLVRDFSYFLAEVGCLFGH
jgi:hypothetical protein